MEPTESYSKFYSNDHLVKMAKGYLEEARKLENENHALWCDVGEHAFSPKTKGYERWTKEINDTDTGYLTKVTMLVCPAHLGKTNTPPPITGSVTSELRKFNRKFRNHSGRNHSNHSR